MPARLLIYETTHHETLPSLLDLAELYFESVTVFLREITYQNICGSEAAGKWKNTVFFRQSARVSNREFIRNAIQYAGNNGYTHFHISTLDNNLLYFAILLRRLPGLHISLSIQAINGYRAFRFKNLRDITESFAKLYFHRRIRHYRFFFPKMAEAFHQGMPQANCQFIPSRFLSELRPEKPGENEYLRIVIPGSINPQRRDYEFVVSFVADNLPAIASEKGIELVLLGNINTPYGLKLLDELKTKISDDLHIKYYFEYVPQLEYEQQLAKADIIWSPIHIKTRGIRGTPEIYGISMATGLIADLLLSCRPALVPVGFVIPEHYQDALIPYDSPSALAERIMEFVYGFDENRNSRIRNALSFFSVENFKSAFEELMHVTP